MIRPSALYVFRYFPSTRVSIRIILARAPLLITTSLRTVNVAISLSPLSIEALSIPLSSITIVPVSISSRRGYISSSVTSVRNPRLPRFTPSIGVPFPPINLATLSRVPSPPNTIINSDCDAISCFVYGVCTAINDAVSWSINGSVSCSLSHLTS